MLFVSPSFLFLFLPIALGVYAILPPKSRRYGLLAINLLFYFFLCWNEPISFMLALVTAAFTYSAGFLIAVTHRRKTLFFSAVVLAIAFFTYRLFQHYALLLNDPYYPLGSSIYLLAAISYLFDIYRSDAPHAKNIADLLLYMLFFPTIVVGPMIKYKDFGVMLERIDFSLENFGRGIGRFVSGFLKRIALSAVLGYTLVRFAADVGQNFGIWAVLICALLVVGEILLAIAGYYDMGCGLMLMFGIRPPASDRIQGMAVRRLSRSFYSWCKDYMLHPILRLRHLPRGLRYASAAAVLCFSSLIWFKTRWYLLPFAIPPLLGRLLLCLPGRKNGRSLWSYTWIRGLSRLSVGLMLVIFFIFLPIERPADIVAMFASLKTVGTSLLPEIAFLGLSALKYLPIGIIGVLCLHPLCRDSGQTSQGPNSVFLQVPLMLIGMACFVLAIIHLLPQFPDSVAAALPHLVL